MSGQPYIFRLRHARWFHLQRLFERNPIRTSVSLFIATFALFAMSICFIGIAVLVGATSEIREPSLTGARLVIAYAVTFGVGPSLWTIAHTYRPQLDFYADSIYIHDWSRSRSVTHADVDRVTVTTNGRGSTVAVPSLGIEDLTVDRPASILADEIVALGLRFDWNA